jgi:GTPase SAR1 family protein
MDDMKIKLVLVGPAKVGKTRITNYLAEFEETPNFETYNPTVRA